MSKRESNLRQSIILDRLKRRPTSFKEIDAFLKSREEITGCKLSMSLKTFRRDLNEILSFLHIDIQFNHSKQVYYIASEYDIEENGRRLEAFDVLNMLELSEGLSKYLHFEKRKSLGTENLHGLLHAIKNKLIVTYSFKDFWEDEMRDITAEPYALKEFKSRWYLLAKDLSNVEITRFGLDRLTGLQITRKKFEPPKDFDVGQLYDNCFGIILPNGYPPSEVLLSFGAYQGKYIKSLPLHHSQQIVKDNDIELQVKLKVFITHDLVMELLSYGETLTVLHPEELKTLIRETLESALENYL